MLLTDPLAPRPTRIRWQVFSLAFGTSALLYLHRYLFSFIKPILAKDWGLNNEELGELDAAFSIPYTLAQFPLAVAADALGVHLVLSGLMLVWCGGLALIAWAPSAKWLWYAQATFGVGQSAVYACLCRIAQHWYPPRVRTTLQGVAGVLAGRLGGLGSALLFSTLLLGEFHLEWRTATWIMVAIGIVHLLLFSFMFRNSPRTHRAVNAAEVRLIEGDTSDPANPAPAGGTAETPAAMSVGTMLRSMSPRSLINLLCLTLQSVLSTFADNIYSNWIPLFLFQVHDLKYKEMGMYSSLPLLGGAVAGVMGGLLNDFCIARTGNRRWSRTGVGFVGKGLAAALMFAALVVYDNPYLFCALLFFVKLFGDWSLTTAWGVVTDIGGRATASVFAFNNSVASISFIAAPKVFGYAADHYGWKMVFVIVGVTYALCALSWLFIDCTIPVLGSKQNDECQSSNVESMTKSE